MERFVGRSLLAEGTFRTVYDLHDGTVLKVAKESGVSANLQEARIFREVQGAVPEDRLVVRLAEIVESAPDGSWVRMKGYFSPAPYEMFRWLTEVIPTIDWNPNNVALDSEGRLVLLDYEGLHWTWFDTRENPYYRPLEGSVS